MLAVQEGRDLVVEWLLEAKAAVDAKDKSSRGLGRGFGGEILLRQWNGCGESETWMSC